MINIVKKLMDAFNNSQSSNVPEEEFIRKIIPPTHFPVPAFSPKLSADNYFGWVYACASVNANTCASIPLRLYVKSKGKKKYYGTKKLSAPPAPLSFKLKTKMLDYKDGDWEEVSEHPILDMLRYANPYQNGIELKTQRFLDLELTGNAYIYKIYDASGIPVQLWWMASKWMQIETGQVDIIKNYIYNQWRWDRIDPKKIIHFKYPNPNSYVYGMGKVEAVW